jgi:hypothetical protein
MFFNLFRKKDKDIFQKKFTNIIYISEIAKQRAILKYANEKDKIIFIAWFTNTLHDYRNLFIKNNIDEFKITDARTFSGDRYADKQIVFLEHYPLRAKEEALVKDFGQEEFLFYNALTDPLFQTFGGDRLIDLMHRMGYKEDEAVQHKMIDTSLLRAQQKIADKVPFETITSASQKEWMLVNAGM